MANFNGSTNATSSATAAIQPMPALLEPQERRLLANFRAMKRSVRDVLLDVSEEFAEAFPDNEEIEVKA